MRKIILICGVIICGIVLIGSASYIGKENESIVGTMNATHNSQKGQEIIKGKLYFSDIYGEKIRVEERYVHGSPEGFFKELMRGPNDEGLKGVLQKDIPIPQIAVEEGVAYVDIGDELYDLIINTGRAKRQLIIESIVATLCDNEPLGIDEVQFLYKGEYIEELVEENEGSTLTINQAIIGDDIYCMDLYFVDIQSNKLTSEERYIESDIELVLNELLKGPQNLTLTSSIPPGTYIEDVRVEEDKAFIDVNKSFYDSLDGKPEQEINLGIMSLINTICLNEELGINKVSILVEGESVDAFGEYSSFVINNEGIVE